MRPQIPFLIPIRDPTSFPVLLGVDAILPGDPIGDLVFLRHLQSARLIRAVQSQMGAWKLARSAGSGFGNDQGSLLVLDLIQLDLCRIQDPDQARLCFGIAVRDRRFYQYILAANREVFQAVTSF